MKYSLGKQDLTKIFKGLIIALSGAFLTYLSSIIGQVDFGIYTPIVVAVLAAVVNVGWKILDGVRK